MKTLGLFDTKNRFSEVCDEVARTGEPCVVTRRGRALVRIVPADEGSASSVWDTVEEGRSRYGAVEEEFELPPRNVKARRRSPL
ncbi:MAG: type II toxin-antitoxin system Phd/YefM family antitoxin [Opitutales bacterium]|nr:type II toxin-antitoxin system Phd/YefM family antitoxin [Opitutales bacterium]